MLWQCVMLQGGKEGSAPNPLPEFPQTLLSTSLIPSSLEFHEASPKSSSRAEERLQSTEGGKSAAHFPGNDEVAEQRPDLAHLGQLKPGNIIKTKLLRLLFIICGLQHTQIIKNAAFQPECFLTRIIAFFFPLDHLQAMSKIWEAQFAAGHREPQGCLAAESHRFSKTPHTVALLIPSPSLPKHKLVPCTSSESSDPHILSLMAL